MAWGRRGKEEDRWGKHIIKACFPRRGWDNPMQALSLWRYVQSVTVPSVVDKAGFWNEQGHIIQQWCVSDKRGKSLNLQFHAAPPGLWFLPLGLADKILNFKHTANAHPVKTAIEDEALWVRACFHIACWPVKMAIMWHFKLTHTCSFF